MSVCLLAVLSVLQKKATVVQRHMKLTLDKQTAGRINAGPTAN